MKLEAKEILLEAEKLTNNDRKEQYGNIQESFNLYSEILKTCFGLELKPTEIAKVMMAIKLGRQKFRHKMDNLVDLAGYTKILGVLQEGESKDKVKDFTKSLQSALDKSSDKKVVKDEKPLTGFEFLNDIPFIEWSVSYNEKLVNTIRIRSLDVNKVVFNYHDYTADEGKKSLSEINFNFDKIAWVRYMDNTSNSIKFKFSDTYSNIYKIEIICT